MDPQIVQDLQDQLQQLSEAISRQTSAMTGLSRSMAESSSSINQSSTPVNQATSIANQGSLANQKSTTATNAAKKAYQEAGDVINEAAAGFASGVVSTQGALKNFADKLMGTEEGFGKYGATFTGLGDAAFSVGKSFGLLGGLFGGLLKVGGHVAAHMAKQADAIGNAYDSVAKMGAAGTFTMEEVRQMGRNAGLSSMELDKLIKPMQSVEGGFSGLGGSQSSGIKRFGELVNVSREVRNQFRHLGMGDEERNQALADYITTMNKSGAAFSGTLSSQKGLQKAALAYTRNLYELADITGQDVATEQQRREELASTMETALQQNKWEQQLQAAQARRANGSPEEQRAAAADIARIEQEKAGFDQLNNEIRQAGMSVEQGRALQRQYLTGKVDEAGAPFALQGLNTQEYLDRLKTGRAKKGELAEASKNAAQKTIDTVGVATLGVANEARDALGLADREYINRLTQMSDTNYVDQAAQAARDVGTGMNTDDPAQKARDTAVELERTARLAVDDYEAAHNPFLGNTGILNSFGTLLGIATAALAGIAAVKGLSSIASLLSGGGAAGSAGAAESALTAAAAGSPVAGRPGPVAASPGLPKLRKADLVDKRGRTLQGAALDARLSRLARERGPAPSVPGIPDKKSGLGAALKSIGEALAKAGQMAPSVILGGLALGAAIAELGAGIAGATWIIGKAIPTLASGIKSFNKIDGRNLAQVGLGMAGLGAGILAMGAGTIAQSIGNIGKYLTGGKDPLTQSAEMLFKLGQMDLDRKKIENNGASLMAFAKAMTAISALGAVSGIANAAKGIYNGIASLLGAKLPVEELEDFSNLNVNHRKVKSNSESLAVFAKAMSSFKGSSDKQSSAAIAETTRNFFNAKPPYEHLTAFAELNVDSKRVKKNATAFKIFAEAMGSYEGFGSSAGAAGTAIAEATTSFFSATPPFDQMVRFGELPVNTKKVKKNAIAFTQFSEALASYSGLGSPTGQIGTVLAQTTAKFFGVKPPIDEFVSFSHLNVNQKKTKINAKSFVLFSEAMATYKGGQGLLSAVSTIAAAGLNKLFGQDSAIDAFYNFSKMDFGAKAVENATAFLNFSKAMGILSGGSSAYDTGAQIGAGLVGAIAGAGAAAVSIVGDLVGGQSAPGPDSKALNFIGKIESGNNYNKLVGGKVKNDPPLTDMTVAQVMAFQDTMRARGHETTALGKYQIIKGTLAGVVSSGAIRPSDKFNAQTQDTAAIQLMKMRGKDRYRSGRITTDQYANNLAKEWASLPMPNGRSFYAGHGSNRSLVPRSEFVGALQAKKGGLFTGPSTGYPMELHGTEMVIPQMSQSSLLAKLSRTNAAIADMGNIINAAVNSLDSTSISAPAVATQSALDISFLNPEMIVSLSKKFDSVITILEENDDAQDQILKHSMV